MSTYDKSFKKSLAYFDGDELAANVFLTKYALTSPDGKILEETPDDMHKRLAKEFARIEQKYPNPLSEDEIYNLFKDFKYIIPQGSPMAGIGNPYQNMSISNCFVIDSPYDSYGGLLKTDQEEAQIMKRRGGVGFDISTIRPKGVQTANAAKTTDGIAVFMERFSNTCREVAQGGRRGALMLSISVHHPEIETFINIKRDLTKVTGANISVRLTDEFMKAVENDKDYEVRFPVDSDKPTITNRLNARGIWDQIIESAHSSAEPGLLFWDTVQRRTPAEAYPEFRSVSTNPCLSGATLIATADGRNAVSIKQLAEEGKDVPVYSVDPYSGIVSIKMGRNPRITGYNKELVRITLDDGTYYDVTPNHGMLLRDGTKIEAKDLKPGDSLSRFTKLAEPVNKNGELYYRINTNTLDNSVGRIFEHRLISQFNNPNAWEEKKAYAKEIGFAKTGGIVVHHRDFNGLNNSPDNLDVLTFREHQALHANLADMAGEKNPRFTGHTENEIRQHAICLTQKLNRRFSHRDWQEYAKEKGLPQTFSDYRTSFLGTLFNLAEWAAIESDIEHLNADPRLVKSLQSMRELGYTSRIDGHVVLVEKICENCQNTFEVEHVKREISFCSHTCSLMKINSNQEFQKMRTAATAATYAQRSVKTKEDQARIYSQLKFELKRQPLMKEWEIACKKEGVSYRLKSKNAYQNFKELATAGDNYNHKVVSVDKLDGLHTVYNLTVDNNHTFSMITETVKNGVTTFSGINTTQCGEIVLSPYDSCRLLLVNVYSFVENPFTPEAEFNFPKFRNTCILAQRLMDDMVDLEIECIDKILAKIQADPEPEDVKANEINLWNKIRNACVTGRRTGTGVTAVGDAVAALNLYYGSDNSVDMIERIYRELAVGCYESTIEMAKERGPFPAYDYELEKDHEFINQVVDYIPGLSDEWKKYGRRNIALTTTAPAGSVSVLTQTTSGIEPAYLLEYKRRKKINPNDKDVTPDFIDELGDKWVEFPVYHHGFKKWMDVTGKTDIKESPYYGATSNDINWVQKVKAQAAAQKWICHAISNTTNLPSDVSIETVKDIYMTGWKSGCFIKGTPVLTPDGLVEIENLESGDYVYSHDGSIQMITETFELPAQKRVLAQIEAYGLPQICATADHPFLILRSEKRNWDKIRWEDRENKLVWVKADEIKDTDYLLVPKLQAKTYGLESIQFSDYLQPTEYLIDEDHIYPARMLPWKNSVLQKIPRGISLPNEIKLTSEVLYFLGIFTAEGHFSRRSCLRINLNINEVDIADRCQLVLENVFGVSVKRFNTESNNGVSLRLEWYSSIMSRWLEVVIGRGSRNKHLPLFFKQLNSHSLKTLIDGHFDGDKGVTISSALAKDLYVARLIIGQAPFFERNYGQGFDIHESPGTGPTGREFENFYAYRVRYNNLIPYDKEVYNLSVENTNTYNAYGIATHNCKGVTIYRDGSRSGVLISNDEKPKDNPEITIHHAPKRPIELPCEVHSMTVLGEKWTFFVGLLSGRPYEIMGGLSKHVSMPKRVRHGKTVKHNGPTSPKARYDFHYDYEDDPDNEVTLRDIATLFDNATYSAFTRTISLALRHGTDVRFIVEQIQKGAEKEDDLFSFSKAVSRVLKGYIEEGTKVVGKKCSECGSDDLKYTEGCLSCNSCGWSKCT